MREGWVFCGGMIRSGSTLQYQVASELIERLGLGRRTGYVPPSEHTRMLAGTPAGMLGTFKTHELTEPIADQVRRNRSVALYIHRDLRDVVSSLQQKEGARLEGEHLAGTVRELLRRDSQWRALPRVYVSRYEDVIFGLGSEVLRIAGFLAISCPGSLATEIASVLSYREQEQGIAAAAEQDLIAVNPTNVYHRHTLLHRNHFQGGLIGRYRVDLTAGQRAVIEDIAGPWLAQYGYT
jgi:hypothetical protein